MCFLLSCSYNNNRHARPYSTAKGEEDRILEPTAHASLSVRLYFSRQLSLSPSVLALTALSNLSCLGTRHYICRLVRSFVHLAALIQSPAFDASLTRPDRPPPPGQSALRQFVRFDSSKSVCHICRTGRNFEAELFIQLASSSLSNNQTCLGLTPFQLPYPPILLPYFSLHRIVPWQGTSPGAQNGGPIPQWTGSFCPSPFA